MKETKLIESPLDYLDMLIVYGLAKFSPRNIYRIARELDIPESTIRYRIKNMIEKNYLYLFTNVYHTNLGLKKLFLFADVNPVYWENILVFFKENEYWSYLTQLLTNRTMVYGLYTVPYNYVPNAIDFFDEMVKLDIIYDYELYHSTCFHRVNPSLKWYDTNRNGWVFNWKDIIDEIDSASTDLPKTLRDPEKFENYADETDIEILWRLELDATKTFSELAKELNTTPQNIRYHYNEHIIKRFLIEGFEIYVKKYSTKNIVNAYTVIDFTNMSSMAKLANVLRKRPFTEVLGKILERSSLLVDVTLPMSELVNYIQTLNTLVKKGYIKRYKYYLKVPSLDKSRQTIPHKFFRNGEWVYDHESMVKDLYERWSKFNKEEKIRIYHN